MGESLPLFPLGTVLFPGMLLPLHIFEERYRTLMRDRHGEDPMFGVVLTKQGREVGEHPETHGIGTAARLIGAGRYPDGRYDIVVQGRRRFRVGPGDWSAGYLVADVEWLEEPAGTSPETGELPALAASAIDGFERFLAAVEATASVEIPREELPDDPGELAYALCARLPLDTWERQALLELSSDRERLEHLGTTLRRERALLLTTGAGGATVAHPGVRFSSN